MWEWSGCVIIVTLQGFGPCHAHTIVIAQALYCYSLHGNNEKHDLPSCQFGTFSGPVSSLVGQGKAQNAQKPTVGAHRGCSLDLRRVISV